MYILGIESSCDETAAAIVEDGKHLISNVISTSVKEQALYGGVVPEIASRRHCENVLPVVQKALDDAQVTLADLDGIAVTYAPGLIGALLVGVNFAKGLSLSTGLPLVPTHHLRSHIASNYISNQELKPPFLCLVVSGGHSHIVMVEDYTKMRIIGKTRDDAAGEAFERLEPDKRILMYSRSACIGMHRYGGIWTGDNHSWWSHILLALHMMPSLNMCGFLYEGPDIGGFGSNTTEDLVLRWYGMGIFSPLLRNHSANGTRRQEPYRFKNKAAFAGILQLRYLLLPYIYSEYMKAALHDGMYCMPLAFAFPEDDFARRVEDEVMIGESLLIAPVYEQNARGRYVYLPEEMLQVRVKCSESNRIETSVLPAGHHYIPVELDEVVFFMRKGHLLPLAKDGKKIQSVADVDFADLRLLAYAPDGASYEYYTDDGETKDYDKPEHFVHITLDADGNAKSDRATVKVEG